MPDIYIPLSLGFLGAGEPAATSLAAEPMTAPPAAPPSASSEHLSMSVDELELSVRTTVALESGNIRFVGEIVRMSETDLLSLKSFGGKSLREIKEILGDMGLAIGMDVGEWAPPA